MFDVDLNALGGDNWQLDDTFTINYDLNTAYLDLDQNGIVDTTVDTSGNWATSSFDGFYSDPSTTCPSGAPSTSWAAR